MLYEALLARVYNTPHLIHPDKLEAIRRVVTARALGLRADAATLQQMREDAQSRRRPQVTRSVAVLPILGTLVKRAGMIEDSSGLTSTDTIGRELDRLLADDAVGAIVLDIDSPGGESFGVRELFEKIFAARGRKPIVASANPEAASAAYYIGSAADELVMTPSGWVGSIGVVTVHTDLSAANEQLGQKITYITAGKYKVEGNPDQPLAPETVAYYTGQADAIYRQFLADVARGRGTTAAEVRANYGEGRMLQAKEAKAAGMVDRIETFDETIARLAGSRPAKSRGTQAQRQRLALAERR